MTTATPPLILLPGLLCDATLWQAQAEALSPHFTLIIPDLTKHDSIPALARHVLEQVDEVLYSACAPSGSGQGENADSCMAGKSPHPNPLPEGEGMIADGFILGGLSMGGYVALEMVRQLHEAGEAERVNRLMLLATSAREDTPSYKRMRRGLIQLAQKGKFKGVTPKLLPTLVHPDHVEQQPLASDIFAMAERVGDDAFIAQELAIMQRRDHREFLPSISCPTLIVVGDADQRTPPECSEEMHVAIPDSQLHILPQCGHLPPMEKPAETTVIMQQFLGLT